MDDDNEKKEKKIKKSAKTSKRLKKDNKEKEIKEHDKANEEVLNRFEEATSALDKLDEIISSLSKAVKPQRVFLILEETRSNADGAPTGGFNVSVLDQTSRVQENNQESVCTIMAAGIVALLDEACDFIYDRGAEYLGDREKERDYDKALQEVAERNSKNTKDKKGNGSDPNSNIVFFKDHKKYTNPHKTEPVLPKVNFKSSDEQLEINFTLDDNVNLSYDDDEDDDDDGNTKH